MTSRCRLPTVGRCCVVLAVLLAGCGSTADNESAPVRTDAANVTLPPDTADPVATDPSVVSGAPDTSTSEGGTATLHGVSVSTFMYQIQELDDPANIDILAASSYDMLVVEPGFNFTESPYDVEYLVDQLATTPDGDDRLLLAYVDIGQAEDYRNYWGDDWQAPTETEPGSPDFLVSIDPDGWEGNFPVAYWDSRWHDLWLGDDGLIDQIASYGFDGVYLDWVEAYDDDQVRSAAEQQGVQPESEMLDFIEQIGRVGQSTDPDFLVIAQNAPYLLDADPARYAQIIDGLATEDTWFYGEGDAEWDAANAGDLAGGERHAGDYSTSNRIEQNQRYLDLGIPVFTVDYATGDNAAYVYEQSRLNGFIPLVTKVSLSQLTDTPPK